MTDATNPKIEYIRKEIYDELKANLDALEAGRNLLYSRYKELKVQAEKLAEALIIYRSGLNPKEACDAHSVWLDYKRKSNGDEK